MADRRIYQIKGLNVHSKKSIYKNKPLIKKLKLIFLTNINIISDTRNKLVFKYNKIQRLNIGPYLYWYLMVIQKYRYEQNIWVPNLILVWDCFKITRSLDNSIDIWYLGLFKKTYQFNSNVNLI